jgi:hypothetical protein
MQHPVIFKFLKIAAHCNMQVPKKLQRTVKMQKYAHCNSRPAFKGFIRNTHPLGRRGLLCSQIRVWSLICNKKSIVLFEKTACQRPLHVQGDAGHPGQRSGGQKNYNKKKCRAV